MSKLAELLAQKNQQLQAQTINRNKNNYWLRGEITRVVGLTLEAQGCTAAIGSQCLIQTSNASFIAEVVGFDEGKLLLMATEDFVGVAPGAKVTPTGKVANVAVGLNLLGRVIDGTGNILDGAPSPSQLVSYPLHGRLFNPLHRAVIDTPLDVGVRAINGLLTVGRGQRMGLFAGSGVGKSVLLGMMTRFTSADIVVVGLIGERGREVKEFIEQTLGPAGLARAIVIAAPADTSPLMRLHGAMRACAIAEYFRDQGAHVLLLLDSLTRFAQAQRELALSIGEPPATKGYPPSVFAKLNKLVERAGNAFVGGGSVTGFYTVLTEGDDQQDPIADSARAILDGHIVLSRQIAEAGQYPAIDISASISRVMPSVTTESHQQLALRFKRTLSRYQQSKDLIEIGAYQSGHDKELDEALRMMPALRHYLCQSMQDACDFDASQRHLIELWQS